MKTQQSIFFCKLHVCFSQGKIFCDVAGGHQYGSGKIVAGIQVRCPLIIVLNDEYKSHDFQQKKEKGKVIPDYVGK